MKWSVRDVIVTDSTRRSSRDVDRQCSNGEECEDWDGEAHGD